MSKHARGVGLQVGWSEEISLRGVLVLRPEGPEGVDYVTMDMEFLLKEELGKGLRQGCF